MKMDTQQMEWYTYPPIALDETCGADAQQPFTRNAVIDLPTSLVNWKLLPLASGNKNLLSHQSLSAKQ